MFKFDINLWFRALARFCDYCLFFLFLGAITLFLPFFYGPLFYYFLALSVPLLWAPIEAYLISKWATTPGKILFGLTVRHVKGAKLSYKAALRNALFLPARPGVTRHAELSFKRKMFAFAASAVFMLAAIYGNVFALWSMGLSKGIPVERWVQYSSSDVGFKVSFPTEPEHASKELVIPDSGKVIPYKEITSDENEKVFYSLSHLKITGTWRLASNSTLLKGVLDLLVKHSQGELLEKEFKQVGSYRVLNFRMKQGEEEVKGRLIKANGTLYKLTITYPSSHSAKMQDNPFLDSFEGS